jgi:hypothetical protein
MYGVTVGSVPARLADPARHLEARALTLRDDCAQSENLGAVLIRQGRQIALIGFACSCRQLANRFDAVVAVNQPAANPNRAPLQTAIDQEVGHGGTVYRRLCV